LSLPWIASVGSATSQACKKWKSLKRDHRNKKTLLRVTNVIAHGPGIKLLDGLAEASTNGETTYAYRCRPRFFSTRHGLDWTGL
jgi:hypothetical protein